MYDPTTVYESNQVYKIAKDLSGEKVSDFLVQLMPRQPDLDINWEELVMEAHKWSSDSSKIEAIERFDAASKIHLSSYYKDNYYYAARILCDEYLRRGDTEKLKGQIDFIGKNPVPGIDYVTLRLLYQLIYHGHYSEAYTYAMGASTPLAESEELMFNPEERFVSTIYLNNLQNAYLAIKSGQETIAHDEFFQTHHGPWNRNDDTIREALRILGKPLDKDLVDQGILAGNYTHMLKLNLQFMKYMLETHKIPFMLSDIWWSYISYKSLLKKGKNQNPMNWFLLKLKSLNKHIDKTLDIFLGINDLEIFGKVWGLRYVYEFLYQSQVISDEVAEEMKLNIQACQDRLMEFMGDKNWTCSFIMQWPGVESWYDNKAELVRSSS